MKTSDILIIFVDGRTATREVRSIALGSAPGDLAVTLADGSAEMHINVRHWFANYIEQGDATMRNQHMAHDCPSCHAARAVHKGPGSCEGCKPLATAARELADRCDRAELADGSSPDTLGVRAALGDLDEQAPTWGEQSKGGVK